MVYFTIYVSDSVLFHNLIWVLISEYSFLFFVTIIRLKYHLPSFYKTHMLFMVLAIAFICLCKVHIARIALFISGYLKSEDSFRLLISNIGYNLLLILVILFLDIGINFYAHYNNDFPISCRNKISRMTRFVSFLILSCNIGLSITDFYNYKNKKSRKVIFEINSLLWVPISIFVILYNALLLKSSKGYFGDKIYPMIKKNVILIALNYFFALTLAFICYFVFGVVNGELEK